MTSRYFGHLKNVSFDDLVKVAGLPAPIVRGRLRRFPLEPIAFERHPKGSFKATLDIEPRQYYCAKKAALWIDASRDWIIAKREELRGRHATT